MTVPARIATLALAALAVAALAAAPAAGFASGRADRAGAGCGDAGCHGGVGPAPGVAPVLDGLPEAYVPGETYVLNVTIAGARDALPPPVGQYAGGFALGATDGALSPLPGAEDVQVDEETGNATHTEAGARGRAWAVVWTAPPATAGVVTFHVAVNAVNGNAAPDPLDEWAVAAFSTTEGAEPEPPTPPRVNESGGATGPEERGVPAPAPLAALALALALRRRR